MLCLFTYIILGEMVDNEEEEEVGVENVEENVISQMTATSISSSAVVVASESLEPRKRILELSESEFHLFLPLLYNERLKRYREGDSPNILEGIYNDTIVAPMVEVQAVPLVPNQVGIAAAPAMVKKRGSLIEKGDQESIHSVPATVKKQQRVRVSSGKSKVKKTQLLKGRGKCKGTLKKKPVSNSTGKSAVKKNQRVVVGVSKGNIKEDEEEEIEVTQYWTQEEEEEVEGSIQYWTQEDQEEEDYWRASNYVSVL